MEERLILISKCDRCGSTKHGMRHVRRVEGLIYHFWFFICPELQEPMYISDEAVSAVTL